MRQLRVIRDRAAPAANPVKSATSPNPPHPPVSSAVEATALVPWLVAVNPVHLVGAFAALDVLWQAAPNQCSSVSSVRPGLRAASRSAPRQPGLSRPISNP